MSELWTPACPPARLPSLLPPFTPRTLPLPLPPCSPCTPSLPLPLPLPLPPLPALPLPPTPTPSLPSLSPRTPLWPSMAPPRTLQCALLAQSALHAASEGWMLSAPTSRSGSTCTSTGTGTHTNANATRTLRRSGILVLGARGAAYRPVQPREVVECGVAGAGAGASAGAGAGAGWWRASRGDLPSGARTTTHINRNPEPLSSLVVPGGPRTF